MTGITPDLVGSICSAVTLGADVAAHPIASETDVMKWAGWILWLPLISLILCGLCAALRVKNRAPALITVALLGDVIVESLSGDSTMTSPGRSSSSSSSPWPRRKRLSRSPSWCCCTAARRR